MKINQNHMAIAIARREAGKTQVSIGQIKEVLKITLHMLANENIYDVLDLLRKHYKRK